MSEDHDTPLPRYSVCPISLSKIQSSFQPWLFMIPALLPSWPHLILPSTLLTSPLPSQHPSCSFSRTSWLPFQSFAGSSLGRSSSGYILALTLTHIGLWSNVTLSEKYSWVIPFLLPILGIPLAAMAACYCISKHLHHLTWFLSTGALPVHCHHQDPDRKMLPIRCSVKMCWMNE